jgi:hypothetical protein
VGDGANRGWDAAQREQVNEVDRMKKVKKNIDKLRIAVIEWS